MSQSVRVCKAGYVGRSLIMNWQEGRREPLTRRRRRVRKPQTRLYASEGSLRRLRDVRKKVLRMRLMVADGRTRSNLGKRRSWLFMGAKGLPTLARISARRVHGRNKLS